MKISDRVEAFVCDYYRDGGDAEFQDEYQQIFADEGFRKANYILDDLKAKQKEYKFRFEDLAYLSIGGADGSEAEAVLQHCEIPHAVVLEIDTPACNRARERGSRLSGNKTLEVFEGDALGRLDHALEAIRNRGAQGLVVSAQAILHELPSRAPSFDDFNDFFGKLLGSVPLVLLYAREPCQPVGYPFEHLVVEDFIRPAVYSDLVDACAVVRRVPNRSDGHHAGARRPGSGRRRHPACFHHDRSGARQ